MTSNYITPLPAAEPDSAAESPGATSARPLDTGASTGLRHEVPDVYRKPKYLDADWIREGVPNTEFYKDYPPDPWGEEAAPNARVWKIYRDEMTSSDATMLESWNKTLDVLLIFAGLFSAVSTAFIVESYKALQPDYTEYVAKFLYAAAKSKPAAGGGTIVLPNVDAMGPPDAFVHPSTTQRWTNGLWFTSLVISLTVALLCILIKQWLDEYHARTTRSAPSFKAWARRHQLYFRGLDTWCIPALISLLPVLLHASLFLFFSGLVLFLQPLDGATANTLLTILTVTVVFYVLSLVIPAWRIECPSYMPLVAKAQSGITLGVYGMLLFLSTCIERCASALGTDRILRILETSSLLRRHISTLAPWRLRELLTGRSRSKQRAARETSALDEQQSDLDGQALTALLVSTNDADVIDAGVEAIGAIIAHRALEVVVHSLPAEVIDERTCRDLLNTGPNSSAFAVMTDARRLRTMRTLARTRSRLLLDGPLRRQPMLDLYPFLGLDGMLIQLMSNGLGHPDRSVAAGARLRELLSAYVLNMPLGFVEIGHTTRVDESHSRPSLDRATCLLFISMLRNNKESLGMHRIPCLLLTFCAGNFALADPHEHADILWMIYTVLEPIPVHPFWIKETEMALYTLDLIFASLSTDSGLHSDLDAEIARAFANHLGLLSRALCRSLPTRLRWDQLKGFASLVQNSLFQHHDLHQGLEGYAALLDQADVPAIGSTPSLYPARIPGSKEESFEQYWTCVATLLNLSYKVGLPPSGSERALLRKAADMFNSPQQIIPFLKKDTYNTVLMNFLRIPSTISCRTGVLNRRPCSDLQSLVDGLSCLLVHRQRIQAFLNTEMVKCLFTGSFLTDIFRCLAKIHSYDERIMRRAISLATHCARLSLADMLHICNQLETPSDGENTLDDDQLAFVRRIRRGVVPGGDLSGECSLSCICMAQRAATSSSEPSPIRRSSHILRRISAVPESPA